MERLNVNFKSFQGNHREKTPQEYASILYNEVEAVITKSGSSVGHSALVGLVSMMIDIVKAHDKLEAVYYWNKVWEVVTSEGFYRLENEKW